MDVLGKVDNAIHHVFVARYQQLYSQARVLLQEFNRSSGLSLDEATPEDFQARVIQGERMQGLPDRTNSFRMVDFLLPRVIRDVADGATMRKVTTWVTEKYTTEAPPNDSMERTPHAADKI